MVARCSRLLQHGRLIVSESESESKTKQTPFAQHTPRFFTPGEAFNWGCYCQLSHSGCRREDVDVDGERGL